MPSVRVFACAVVVLLVATAVPAFAQAVIEIPPPETAWDWNSGARSDGLLEINSLLQRQPTIDGTIDPTEWQGAMTREVWGPIDPPTMGGMIGTMRLGMVFVGICGGNVYMANDWTINTSQDPALGGANAWRIGTSTGPGAQNSGLGDWYEVYVQDDGDNDIVMAKKAASEAELAMNGYELGAQFGITAAAGWNGVNWQYELFLSESNNPGEGPGPLPYCYHWEWRQIDPRPLDGLWIPVYDGSLHNNYPEPGTMILLGGGLLALVRKRRKK